MGVTENLGFLSHPEISEYCYKRWHSVFPFNQLLSCDEASKWHFQRSHKINEVSMPSMHRLSLGPVVLKTICAFYDRYNIYSTDQKFQLKQFYKIWPEMKNFTCYFFHHKIMKWPWLSPETKISYLVIFVSGYHNVMRSRGISGKSSMWHFQFSIWLKCSFGEVHFAENPT